MTKYEKFYYHLDINRDMYYRAKMLSSKYAPWFFKIENDLWFFKSDVYQEKITLSDRTVLKLWKLL